MQLRYKPYKLELKNPFTISHSSRTATPAVLLELEHEGIIGYGEASLPPYLGETVESVISFLSLIDCNRYQDLLSWEETLHDIDAIAPGNTAAKAAIDIALHDWVGKKIGLPWYKIWGLSQKNIPVTSFTIGIDEIENVRKKVAAASKYNILKVKLGHPNDKEIITTIREMTSVPIRVDVNQGWNDEYQALDMINWLAERNVELVEQPLPVKQLKETNWLKEKSTIPILADESVQRIGDIESVKGAFSGINIKLMKCTGMREAYNMIVYAKNSGLKVMLGCMTETTCAISAAAQLSPLVDWVDLDGALLIRNDPFTGASFIDGRITPTDQNGIGCSPLDR